MPLALTVFGIAAQGNAAVLCYAFLRDVRGKGAYPKPNLPRAPEPAGTTLLPLAPFEGLELICWDCVLDESAAKATEDDLLQGRFIVPADSPIEPGATIDGQTCEPIIVREGRLWVRSSGTGLLRCRSVATDRLLNNVAECLAQSQGAGKAPAALRELIEQVAKHSGLDSVFTKGHRLGLIDHFWRQERDPAFCGHLLVVVPEKPDLRSKEAMLRCRVQRASAALDRSFTLHVSLANHDELLVDYLTPLPSGMAELTIEAPAHITDVVVDAFNPDGSLAQRLEGAFIQRLEFGIAALGRADRLPKVFRDAPESVDLDNRARVSTSTFKGPSADARSGGFDKIRQDRQSIAAIVGRPNWSSESLWFERVDDQLAVIRWIKARLEDTKTSAAYLVDPFLGSDALRRVVARQGREDIKLTILISPGTIDPDAEQADVEATESHIDKLKAAASDWSDFLCGDISIVDVQRGDGQRQAFHDRFLVLVGRDAVPTAFLFSNSMSKAAGDWPFTICELDQVTSHRVKAYVEDLLKGVDGNRTVTAVSVWKSGDVQEATEATQQTTNTPQEPSRPTWMAAAEPLLAKLLHVSTRTTDGHAIGETVDAFLPQWPSGMDLEAFTEKLVQAVVRREQNLMALSSRLSNGTDEQRDVAGRVDETLLKQVLDNLPYGGKAHCHWMYIQDRDQLLRHLAKTINRKPIPTNFVRDRLNPVIERYIQAMEFQRAGSDLTYPALQIVACLISLGLEVAMTANAPDHFREGMAADYVHWAGRLMRSEAAQTRFEDAEKFDDYWRSDVTFCARQIAAARAGLGAKVEEAASRVLADSMVLPAFQSMLGASRTTD